MNFYKIIDKIYNLNIDFYVKSVRGRYFIDLKQIED